jgi:hypothetical protein
METIGILKFPKECMHHKYNLIHFQFFLQYAKSAGISVDMVDSNEQVFVSTDQLVFSCLINDCQVIFDYADHSTRNWKECYPGLPYFKFQSTDQNSTDMIPLGPPMVGVKRLGCRGATVREYNHIKNHYKYTPGSRILCKQLPNGAAVDRRQLVHKLLQENFSEVDVSSKSNQIDFWRAHEHCLASVCVPGATNNMVDRGHIELIGLGVCTVSPELYTLFPGHTKLTPDYHYIRCKDDYSDLVDILKHLTENPDVCAEIGKNARNFYNSRYTPKQYWSWILENIND